MVRFPFVEFVWDDAATCWLEQLGRPSQRFPFVDFVWDGATTCWLGQLGKSSHNREPRPHVHVPVVFNLS